MIVAGIGTSPPRKEDDRFLRGRGHYVGDVRMVGMQDVAFVRSPVAHAFVRSVHIPDAARGKVFVAADLATVRGIHSSPKLSGFKHSIEPILATDKVRYVGEPIAMCVAATRAQAEDLAARVLVDYDELPAVSDMLAACRPDAARIHADWADNLFVEVREQRGRIDAMVDAPVRVERHIRTARQCAFPLEGSGVVAYRDARTRSLTVITSTQIPHTVQTGLCDCLGLPYASVRVISPDVGGGFGFKCVVRREEVAIAWLASRIGAPVRWLEDCREHLGASANCREHDYVITAYATREGKLLGLDCVAHVDAGAYSAYPVSAATEATQLANILPGPYRWEAYRCVSRAVATNKSPILAYRGVGRTGACLAIETMIDAIARATRLEPCEVRLRNVAPPEAMPYDNILEKHFDSGDHPACIRRAMDAIGLHAIRVRQKGAEADGSLIGVGLSFFCEQAAHGPSVLEAWGRPVVPGDEQATLRLTVDGDIELRVGTHSHGQGHETTFAQVVHHVLGIDFASVKLIQGDTLCTPYSTGTWGSRSMVLAAGAIARACALLARKVCHVAARLMQVGSESVMLADGVVKAIDGRSITLREMARTWYLEPQRLPPDLDPGGLEVTAGYRAQRDSGTFSYAAHAAVVNVDPRTGAVQIVDYVVVEDGGVLVNPMIVDGQILGGTAQGIGTALYEAVRFDAQAQPTATTLMDYIVPGASDVPDVRILHMQTPSPYTTFGLKGIGEGGAVGPPAAIVSAVNDALRGLGAEVHEVPLTPHIILSAIEASKSRERSP